MLHVVTGAAGFIGSRLVAALNRAGVTEILAVDELQRSAKAANLFNLQIEDYLDKRDFIAQLESFVDLDRISPNVTVSKLLLKHSYDSVLAIADTPHSEFVAQVGNDDGVLKALEASKPKRLGSWAKKVIDDFNGSRGSAAEKIRDPRIIDGLVRWLTTKKDQDTPTDGEIYEQIQRMGGPNMAARKKRQEGPRPPKQQERKSQRELEAEADEKAAIADMRAAERAKRSGKPAGAASAPQAAAPAPSEAPPPPPPPPPAEAPATPAS